MTKTTKKGRLLAAGLLVLTAGACSFDEDGIGLASPDPEVNFSSNSAFGRADYASIPMLRQFALGFRLSF